MRDLENYFWKPFFISKWPLEYVFNTFSEFVKCLWLEISKLLDLKAVLHQKKIRISKHETIYFLSLHLEYLVQLLKKHLCIFIKIQTAKILLVPPKYEITFGALSIRSFIQYCFHMVIALPTIAIAMVVALLRTIL